MKNEVVIQIQNVDGPRMVAVAKFVAAMLRAGKRYEITVRKNSTSLVSVHLTGVAGGVVADLVRRSRVLRSHSIVVRQKAGRWDDYDELYNGVVRVSKKGER